MCHRCIEFCEPFVAGSPNETLTFIERIANACQQRILDSSRTEMLLSVSNGTRLHFHCPTCSERFLLISPSCGRGSSGKSTARRHDLLPQTTSPLFLDHRLCSGRRGVAGYPRVSS